MRYLVWTTMILIINVAALFPQDSIMIPEPSILKLEDLEREVLAANPSVRAELDRIAASEARIGGEGLLDPPEFTYRRKSMPGFNWGDSKISEWELMQMVRFPSKYGIDRELAETQAEHAHHQAEEVVNTVQRRLRKGYAELWYIQQKTVLEIENLRIAERVRRIAEVRYGVGSSMRNETLMADMLRTRVRNNLINLRQSELGVKAMLTSILNRHSRDTLGYAVVTENPSFTLPLDTLLSLASRTRPMLLHDSLGISEREIMLTRAKQTYLPDLRLGVMYMDSRMTGEGGWGVSATITLPFAPWSLGRSGSAVEESEAMLKESRSMYDAAKNDVEASVREAYLRVKAHLERLQNISSSILPDAEQSLRVSLSLYQNSEAGYETVHQAYAAYIESQTDYFMARLEYENSLADLRYATGYNGSFDLQ